MIRVEGIVERVEGGFVWVRTEPSGPACGACPRQGTCAQAGGGILDGLVLNRKSLLRLPNTVDARPGDAVSVCAQSGLIVRAAAWLYLFPLLAAFAGAMLALVVTGSEIWAFIGVLAGLAAGFLFVHRWLAGALRLDDSHATPILNLDRKLHY